MPKRVPLGELPLFDFMPPPTSKCVLPSPLSLPSGSKRGPSTPSRTSTPKRPRPVSTLHNDDLGTGKSPARRLFADEPATPTPKKTTKLAPSPPLTSTSTPSKSIPQTPSDRQLHDVGFVIFQDEEHPPSPPALMEKEPSRGAENVPPAPPAEKGEKGDTTPRSSRIGIRVG